MEVKSTPARFSEEIELTVLIWKEGDDFVSLCPELGVSSCGADLEEAREMLREAVELYLENAREIGIWDDISSSFTVGTRWTTSMKIAV
jgi:predicted RNase H-like HicB family nuclease